MKKIKNNNLETLKTNAFNIEVPIRNFAEGMHFPKNFRIDCIYGKNDVDRSKDSFNKIKKL